MKKYNIFLQNYLEIEEDKERLAFMRGYMLSLSPKQFQVFFERNISNGIAAIKELSFDAKNNAALLDVEELAQRLKIKFGAMVQPIGA